MAMVTNIVVSHALRYRGIQVRRTLQARQKLDATFEYELRFRDC